MSGLRVIGGKARGRRLRSVPGDSTRPITDRTKESLFNIIGEDINGASFLDLFAGTGSVGIEALSRGAAYILFNDNQRQAVETIHLNLRSTGFEQAKASGQVEVLRMNAFSLLEQRMERKFDYIYVAPPQYKELWKRTLLALDNHLDILAKDAWVIVQIHPVEYSIPSLVNLVEFDRRQYGSTLLLFYTPYHPINNELR